MHIRTVHVYCKVQNFQRKNLLQLDHLVSVYSIGSIGGFKGAWEA